MAKSSPKRTPTSRSAAPKLVENPVAAADELRKYTRGRLDAVLAQSQVTEAAASDARTKLAEAQAEVTRTEAAHALAIEAQRAQATVVDILEGLGADPQRIVTDHITPNFNRDLAIALVEFNRDKGDPVMDWRRGEASC